MSGLMQSFQAKVQQLFSAGDPVHGLPSRDVVVAFASGGVPLARDDFDASMTNARSAAAVCRLAHLLNALPSSSAHWSAGGEPLWSVYETVLDQAVLAQNELTAEEQQRLDESRDFLLQRRTVQTVDGPVERLLESARYAMYKQLTMVYDRVRLKYNGLLITHQYSSDPKDQALWALNGPVYKQQLQRQYRDLIARGSKNEVEAAIQFIDQVTGRGVALRWRQMKDDFEVSRRTGPGGETYYDTFLTPADPLAAADDAWMQFSFDRSEAAGLQPLAQRAGIAADPEDTAGLARLTVKLLPVAIERPWFDRSVLRSRGWRWAPGAGVGGMLSDGGWPPAPDSMLPLHPTALLLAKELCIEGSEEGLAQAARLGPLSLHGARPAAGRIVCDGVQLIGMICDRVPRCPDPDPALAWL